MQFAFKQQRRIEHQVRSIAHAQIEKALDECTNGDREFGKAVHAVRRRTKKLRGLVRLIEPHFKASSRENRALRDAAAALSATRDAAVMIETFTDLQEFDRRNGASIEATAGDTFARFLKERVGRPPAPAEQDKMLRNFVEAFAQTNKRVGRWHLSGRGFEQIGEGLGTTYRRMRDAMAEAESSGAAKALHEWRKQTKYHWHHVSLFEKTAPAVLKPRKEALDRLGDLLGDHHNLAVLDETLKAHTDVVGAQASRSIAKALIKRQDELAVAAFALGRQLVAEKPRMLADRFERYWALLPEKH